MPEGGTNTEQTHNEPARKRPNRFHSLLLTLATVATILGGIVAGFQIYEHLSKDDSDTKQLDLQGGASVEVPKGWDIMDSDAIQVMVGGMDPRFDSLMNSGDAKGIQFFGPKSDDGPGVVCIAIGKSLPNLNYDSVLADMRNLPNNSLCKKVELENGTSVHAVYLQELRDVEGYPIPITQDCYVFIRGDEMWMLMFMCEDSVYMRESGTFAKIAATFEVD